MGAGEAIVNDVVWWEERNGYLRETAETVERREKLKEIRIWEDRDEGQQRRYLKASLTNPYEQLAPCTHAEVPTYFSFRILLHS